MDMQTAKSPANRDWLVLFVGGPSGTGKSTLARALAGFYQVNILEIDDIIEALKTLTTHEALPAIHHWSTGPNWQDVGVAANVDWLINVSREIAPGLHAIVADHLETGVPLIIEGDFITPAFSGSFRQAEVKALFVHEPDKNQIVQNYLAREGGAPQHYRTDISAAYGAWIANACGHLAIPLVNARPWDTALQRAVASLSSAPLTGPF